MHCNKIPPNFNWFFDRKISVYTELCNTITYTEKQPQQNYYLHFQLIEYKFNYYIIFKSKDFCYSLCYPWLDYFQVYLAHVNLQKEIKNVKIYLDTVITTVKSWHPTI